MFFSRITNWIMLCIMFVRINQKVLTCLLCIQYALMHVSEDKIYFLDYYAIILQSKIRCESIMSNEVWQIKYSVFYHDFAKQNLANWVNTQFAWCGSIMTNGVMLRILYTKVYREPSLPDALATWCYACRHKLHALASDFDRRWPWWNTKFVMLRVCALCLPAYIWLCEAYWGRMPQASHNRHHFLIKKP